jgi:hypothetical protein
VGIQELENYLESKGCQLRGCSMREVGKIETFFNIELPLVYKDFLLSMGKDAGAFMKGSSAVYKEIFDLREGSIRLLNEDNFKALPDDVFVFWMHQGYQFSFFLSKLW